MGLYIVRGFIRSLGDELCVQETCVPLETKFAASSPRKVISCISYTAFVECVAGADRAPQRGAGKQPSGRRTQVKGNSQNSHRPFTAAAGNATASKPISPTNHPPRRPRPAPGSGNPMPSQHTCGNSSLTCLCSMQPRGRKHASKAPRPQHPLPTVAPAGNTPVQAKTTAGKTHAPRP